MGKYHKTSAKTSPWNDITYMDIKMFFWFNYIDGTNKLEWRDYWPTDPLLDSPIFPKNDDWKEV